MQFQGRYLMGILWESCGYPMGSIGNTSVIGPSLATD